MDRIPVGKIHKVSIIDDCIRMIFNGAAVVLFENNTTALAIHIENRKERSIESPNVETTIRGPKDSFVESINTNVSLIRRRLLHKDCKYETLYMGNYNKSLLGIMYVSSLTNIRLVQEVKRRLNTIKDEEIMSLSYIEELIRDHPYSLYPTMQLTERPDKVVAALLEGRIIVLEENNPFALIVPSVFIDFLQSPDDYYNSFWISTFSRYLRYLGLLMTIFLPGLYIAILSFNQEMAPPNLLIAIAYQRQGIPFPLVIEVFIMGIAFEIVKEAGLRLPKMIGQSISIVGGLVIGDAAVKAGLVSPATVVLTALTGMSSFLIPSNNFNPIIVILRNLIIVVSGFMGIWGVFMISVLNLAHLTSLRSFGVPYMAPLSPTSIEDLDDILIRAPIWSLNRKTQYIFRKKYKNEIEHINRIKK